MDQAGGGESEFNPLEYLQIFLSRKWVIFFSFLIVFLSTFIYTNIQTPAYKASLLLKIETKGAFPSEVVFSSPEIMEYELSDYARQLVSRPVIEEAAEELGLIKDGIDPKEKDGIVRSIMYNVNAGELKRGNMIRLYVQSGDPKYAADVANKIFEVFKRMNIEQRNQQIRKVRIFVEETLNNVAGKLKNQEERLQDLTTSGVVGVGVTIIDNIKRLEEKRSELLMTFTKAHPDVVSIDEEITELREKLKNLPKEEFEYRILKRDIAINEGLYTSLRKKLQETRIREAEEIDNVILVNPAAPPGQPFYPNKKKNYLMGIILGLGVGVALAFTAEQVDTSMNKVEDIESFLKTNVLGMIPYCAEKDKGRERVRRRWERVFFKKGRKEEKPSEKTVIPSLEEIGDKRFLEAFRILSVNLQMRFGEGGRIKNKLLMITSCNPEEGKTLVISYLGIIMAQMGYKVLIVDADPRRPAVHKNFGLKTRKDGLTDILTGEISPDSTIKTVTDFMLATTNVDRIMSSPWLSNLNVITAGSPFPNPANLFNSDKMTETLNYFKKKYDVVLIDAPPILAVSEPSIIAARVDEVLLVFRAGLTSRLVLRSTKTQIESAKGKGSLSGVIINNVTPKTTGYYGYYYYKEYYDEEKKSQAAKREPGSKDV